MKTRFTELATDAAGRRTVAAWIRQNHPNHLRGKYGRNRVTVTGGDRPFDHTGILEDDGKIRQGPSRPYPCASYDGGRVLIPLARPDFEEVE